MPISVEYDDDKKIIHTKADGVIKFNDINSYFLSIGELNLKQNYRVLADYSNATLELSSNDINQMATRREQVDSNSISRVKIAVYCSQDLVFGIGRMYEALTDDEKYEIMIFRSYEEACNWLGG